MVLSLFVLVAWLLVAIFIFLPKKLPLVENMFLYLLISILVINKMTILSLNLKLIDLTEKPVLFISFLLNRGVITPLLILILCNGFLTSTKMWSRIGFVVFISASIVLLDYINTSLHVYTYQKIKMVHSLSIMGFIIGVILLVAHWFKGLLSKEEVVT